MGNSNRKSRFYKAFLLLLARATTPELVKQVQFLKTENAMMRGMLPKRINLTPAQKRRLLRFGKPLGGAIRHFISIVSYRTFCRWRGEKRGPKRNLKIGRPRTEAELTEIVVRFARENDGWGYTRILGEMKKLGLRKIARNTVKNILIAHGFDPAPRRGEGTWDEFLKLHRTTLWAMDFLTKEVWTAIGRVTYHVLFFVEVATRRVHVTGITHSPDGPWMAQQARNLSILFEETGSRPEIILKDGDKKITAQFDDILASCGVRVKKISRKSPNLNAYAESWASAIKRECLDKFIVMGERHLRYLVHQYVAWFNSVRPHQGLDNAVIGDAPSVPPEKVRVRDGLVCESRLGGLLNHYRRVA